MRFNRVFGLFICFLTSTIVNSTTHAESGDNLLKPIHITLTFEDIAPRKKCEELFRRRLQSCPYINLKALPDEAGTENIVVRLGSSKLMKSIFDNTLQSQSHQVFTDTRESRAREAYNYAGIVEHMVPMAGRAMQYSYTLSSLIPLIAQDICSSSQLGALGLSRGGALPWSFGDETGLSQACDCDENTTGTLDDGWISSRQGVALTPSELAKVREKLTRLVTTIGEVCLDWNTEFHLHMPASDGTCLDAELFKDIVRITDWTGVTYFKDTENLQVYFRRLLYGTTQGTVANLFDY